MVKRVIPNIRSGNSADGREFYTDVLGLEVVMHMGWIVTFGSPENPTAQLTIVDSDPALPHPDYSVEVANAKQRAKLSSFRSAPLPVDRIKLVF